MIFNTREAETQFSSESETTNTEGSFEELNDPDYWLNEIINAPVNISRTENGGDIADGVTWEVPVPYPPNPLAVDVNSTAIFVGVMDESFSNPTNTTLETHLASYSAPNPDVDADRMLLRDGYEVSFPVENMADCFEGAIQFMESQLPDTGLRIPAFFRLVGRESGLLSVSNDQPQMWFALDDFVYFNRG